MGHYHLSNINTQRRYRDKKIKLGLCVYCNEKAIEGIQVCKHHREKSRKRSREYKLRIKNSSHLITEVKDGT